MRCNVPRCAEPALRSALSLGLGHRNSEDSPRARTGSRSCGRAEGAGYLIGPGVLGHLWRGNPAFEALWGNSAPVRQCIAPSSPCGALDLPVSIGSPLGVRAGLDWEGSSCAPYKLAASASASRACPGEWCMGSRPRQVPDPLGVPTIWPQVAHCPARARRAERAR